MALDKRPGVQPIGVHDTARRITAKATCTCILAVTSEHIQEVAGSQQLCAGQLAGAEAVIYFLLFDSRN